MKVLCGGEALARDLARELLTGGGEVWNLYGPTETTIWSASHRLGAKLEESVPIGRAIANTRIHLLDRNLRRVPMGVAGELCIAGESVARGYSACPSLCAERFVPDPYANGSRGQRLYRTGDLARILPTGELEFQGRIDHQIKIHGHRVETGEIETHLARHPGLRQVVVVVREDAPGDPRLVAYCLRHDAEGSGESLPPPSIDRLRGHLLEALPDYMVPSAFVFLTAFPTTPNGKVDRRALPAPESERPALSTAFQPAETRKEKLIADIWREVLDLDEVGIDDNFFDLGGTSLLTVRVHRRLMELVESDLTVVDMFKYPNIRALAGALRQRRELSKESIDSAADKRKRALSRRRRISRAAAR